MLEKPLYKIVDFGRKHPSLRYVMLRRWRLSICLTQFYII